MVGYMAARVEVRLRYKPQSLAPLAASPRASSHVAVHASQQSIVERAQGPDNSRTTCAFAVKIGRVHCANGVPIAHACPPGAPVRSRGSGGSFARGKLLFSKKLTTAAAKGFLLLQQV